jgi:hypothetical protein
MTLFRAKLFFTMKISRGSPRFTVESLNNTEAFSHQRFGGSPITTVKGILYIA